MSARRHVGRGVLVWYNSVGMGAWEEESGNERMWMGAWGIEHGDDSLLKVAS